jgi:thymidine kinase
MAKLYFNYSSMNAGKSTALLQADYNYRERGMTTILFTSSKDERYGKNEIVSRIGISAPAAYFFEDTNLYETFVKQSKTKPIDCVLIDEAQFLSKEQVHQLGRIVDELDTPVLTFGIRTDFRGELFEGSKYLLAWSDNIKEIKTVCHCGSKATMVIRIDSKGDIILQGSQIEVGGNESYIPLCRKHFNLKQIG